MSFVYFILPVDICKDTELIMSFHELILVSRGMSSEQQVFGDVESIGFLSGNVVFLDEQRVKILKSIDDGIVVCVKIILLFL